MDAGGTVRPATCRSIGKPQAGTDRRSAANEDVRGENDEEMARVTGLEPATSGVTGRHSNRLSYTRASWPRGHYLIIGTF